MVDDQPTPIPSLPLLPSEAISGSRDRDFDRFNDLQASLKRLCACLLHFVRRDYDALAAAAASCGDLCASLRDSPTCDLSNFVPRLGALSSRIETREKLRIVFIGPLKAGKTTLINHVLTAHLGSSVMLLPIDNEAATNTIWKVESCDGSTASVLRGNAVQQTWVHDAADPKSVDTLLAALASHVEEKFARRAGYDDRSEITVRLPLSVLDPFGCHYSLVDTPGYTESQEYLELVAKFLHDHSHIACMVCPLTEGTAVPQYTKNMLRMQSYSRAFWVLTRYDLAMMMRTSKLRGWMPSKRQAADSLVLKFSNEIRSVDPDSRVFLQAADVLMDPDGDLSELLRRELPPSEVAVWMRNLRTHVKECFLAIQQEQYVLRSQSRQCTDVATDIINEYASLKDGSRGTLAASDYYARELQTAVDEVADKVEREIRLEIDQVKGPELVRLTAEAGEEVRATGGPKKRFVQQAYWEALAQSLVPRLEEELNRRLAAVILRAQEQIFSVAHRLITEAGMQDGADRTGQARQTDLIGPSVADSLGARYPVESLLTWSATMGLAAKIAATEWGGTAMLATFGLRLTAMQLFGVVGAAIGGFALIGLSAKYAVQYHPFWSYRSVEDGTVSRFQSANNWGVLAEASCGRARSMLLSSVARFRFAFSEVLLTRGTPRDVLHSIFPDLPLFEALNSDLTRTCADIGEFTEAHDLARSAGSDLMKCSQDAELEQWPSIIDVTEAYVGRNSRTDSIPGRILAQIFHLRCDALVKSNMCGKVAETAEVFHSAFPALILPSVYAAGADILFHHFAGTLESNGPVRARANSCATELERTWAEREVPLMLEIWFHAVAASFHCDSDARPLHLGRLIRDVGVFMESQMKQKPVKAQPFCGAIVRELSTGWDESERQEEEQRVEREFVKSCEGYSAGLVYAVHKLLAELPSTQLDIDRVGPTLANSILSRISEGVAREPPMPREVEVWIRTDLCPIDGGNVNGLHEEWVRILGESLSASHVRNAT